MNRRVLLPVLAVAALLFAVSAAQAGMGGCCAPAACAVEKCAPAPCAPSCGEAKCGKAKVCRERCPKEKCCKVKCPKVKCCKEKACKPCAPAACAPCAPASPLLRSAHVRPRLTSAAKGLGREINPEAERTARPAVRHGCYNSLLRGELTSAWRNPGLTARAA